MEWRCFVQRAGANTEIHQAAAIKKDCLTLSYTVAFSKRVKKSSVASAPIPGIPGTST